MQLSIVKKSGDNFADHLKREIIFGKRTNKLKKHMMQLP